MSDFSQQQPVDGVADSQAIMRKLQDLRNRSNRRTGAANLPSPDDEFIRIYENDPVALRILPGKWVPTGDPNKPWSQKLFYSETAIHRINGKNIHCPKIVKQRCPICDYVNRLYRSGREEDAALGKEMKAKMRFYMNAIQRERRVFDGTRETVLSNQGPLIFSAGEKVVTKLLNYWNIKGVGDITRLKNGYDFIVIARRQGGQQGFLNYEESEASREMTDAGTEEEIDRWMDSLRDLDALIERLSYNDLRQELEMHVQQVIHGSSSDIAHIAMPSQIDHDRAASVDTKRTQSMQGVSSVDAPKPAASHGTENLHPPIPDAIEELPPPAAPAAMNISSATSPRSTKPWDQGAAAPAAAAPPPVIHSEQGDDSGDDAGNMEDFEAVIAKAKQMAAKKGNK